MVVLNKIYTRQGDEGTTTVAGKRTVKWSDEIEALGSLDELNAFIGEARAFHGVGLGSRGRMVRAMLDIQNDLLDIGSIIAGSGQEFNKAPVERLEQQIDSMNAKREPLTSFIIPGSTYYTAKLHVCRTVCRRAERVIGVYLALHEEPERESLRNIAAYINRLSDWFFVAARLKTAEKEDLWEPGKNQ